MSQAPKFAWPVTPIKLTLSKVQVPEIDQTRNVFRKALHQCLMKIQDMYVCSCCKQLCWKSCKWPLTENGRLGDLPTPLLGLLAVRVFSSCRAGFQSMLSLQSAAGQCRTSAATCRSAVWI